METRASKKRISDCEVDLISDHLGRKLRFKIRNFLSKVEHWETLKCLLQKEVTTNKAPDFGQADAKNTSLPQRKSVDVHHYCRDVRFKNILQLVTSNVVNYVEEELVVIRTSLFVDPPGSDEQSMHVDIDPSKWKYRKKSKLIVWNILLPIELPVNENDTEFLFHSDKSKQFSRKTNLNDVVVFNGSQMHRGKGNNTLENRIYLMIVLVPRWLLVDQQGQIELTEQYNGFESLTNANSPVGYWEQLNMNRCFCDVC